MTLLRGGCEAATDQHSVAAEPDCSKAFTQVPLGHLRGRFSRFRMLCKHDLRVAPLALPARPLCSEGVLPEACQLSIMTDCSARTPLSFASDCMLVSSCMRTHAALLLLRCVSWTIDSAANLL